MTASNKKTAYIALRWVLWWIFLCSVFAFWFARDRSLRLAAAFGIVIGSVGTLIALELKRIHLDKRGGER